MQSVLFLSSYRRPATCNRNQTELMSIEQSVGPDGNDWFVHLHDIVANVRPLLALQRGTRAGRWLVPCNQSWFILAHHFDLIRSYPQSLEIGDSLYYNSAWLDFDQSVKKKIILILARAQRPLAVICIIRFERLLIDRFLLLQIKIGNVYPMTLEMFQSLLNASYSYFTLLRRVYN